MGTDGGGAAETGGRLARVRAGMEAAGLDALLVRGTDRYLNEYVPAAESLRLWLSGFTGSVGDVVVASGEAWLFVDGRYYLQADAEVDARHLQVVRVPLGTSLDEAVERRLLELAAKQAGLRIGFEPEKTPVELAERLRDRLGRAGAALVATGENLVGRARGPVPPPASARLEPVADDLTGEPAAAKLGRVREALRAQEADGLLVTRLDEVAWLTNRRAYELDYSATFRAHLFVGLERALLFTDPRRPAAPGDALPPELELLPAEGWERPLAALRPAPRRVLVDPSGTTVAMVEALRRALAPGAEVVHAPSPVPEMKARKNPRELATMAASFRRADAVVAESLAWLNQRVARGRPVTEKDLADEVERRFLAAGARALSFRVIAAAGANGAVIHYSHPDPARRIRKGELVLLDTGAYFEPGYATDLTRTVLAGGAAARATEKQKLVFTLVLKGAVRGMKARFPAGTTGVQLDAIVRAPLWEAGYDFLHGTGHGVGVLVHEFPPRVSNRSTSPLEPGMVFSIEPGLYLPGWGGVRIENLVTVEKDRREGFLRVRPLTFAPLDRRLVEPRLLSADEKAWLRAYRRGRA